MTVFSFILFFSALTNLILTYFGIRFRKSKGSLSFALFTLCLSFYTFGYGVELTCTSLEAMKFWIRFEYVGIVFIPVFWLLVALQYAGKESVLNGFTYTLLFIIPLTSLILVNTNDMHHWFYISQELDTSGSFPVMQLVRGPWYWVQNAFVNICMIIGTGLFIEFIRKSSRLYRTQGIIMLAGSLIPWLTHILYLAGFIPKGLDPTPFALTMASPFYFFGIFRYRLLDIEPFALENVFASMQEGVIIIDRQNRIINFNQSAKKILPGIFPEYLGKPAHLALADWPGLANLILSDDENIQEIKLSESQNSLSVFQATVSAIRDVQQNKMGKLLVLKNITELKQTERILIEGEKKLQGLNATKDKFLSILAHDLRNQLGGFMNLSQVLSEEFTEMSPSEQKEMIVLMKESSGSVYKLLENLLEWSSSQRGIIPFEPEWIELNLLVEEVFDYQQIPATHKNVALINNLPKPQYILADRNMLNSILRNLVSNAIKFTREGGKITVNAESADTYVKVFIQDTGVGIGSEIIDKLFRIDVNVSMIGTSQEKGTGLGLILCKEFIDKHNGKIWVESEYGKGSTFFFQLPVTPDK